MRTKLVFEQKENCNALIVLPSLLNVPIPIAFVSDVNECNTNLHGCQHECLNTVGSFRCRCNSDFELLADGRSCGKYIYI